VSTFLKTPRSILLSIYTFIRRYETWENVVKLFMATNFFVHGHSKIFNSFLPASDGGNLTKDLFNLTTTTFGVQPKVMGIASSYLVV